MHYAGISFRPELPAHKTNYFSARPSFIIKFSTLKSNCLYHSNQITRVTRKSAETFFRLPSAENKNIISILNTEIYANRKNGDTKMDYRKFGECYYIRMDRNDEIISTILEICKKENISSATFSGIGGCKDAEIQTFIPETGSFEDQHISGMLELASLNGNVVTDENDTYYHHTHAVFSYKDGEKHCMAAGHMKSITVLYTAEIELRPVTGGTIHRKYDPETGTGFWDFNYSDPLK